ncbi:MAG: HIT family protein [Saprospiraceae bacterium]|jgi:histidine triad (HIT) family protein
MATIFSKIISGEIPSFKILEDDNYLAFLDVFPLKAGHTLVIPKIETDYIFDMDDENLANMMVFAKRVAKAIKSAIPCAKVGVAVIGLEVAHAHIHLIPITKVSDISFANPKLTLTSNEMEEVASSIRKFL